MKIDLSCREKVNKILQPTFVEGSKQGRIGMCQYNSGVITEIIKTTRPKTILEVGVSAGGTSCVILQAMHDFNLEDSELISVDICTNYNRNPEKLTQFQVPRFIEQTNIKNKHSLFTGSVLADYILQNPDKKYDLVILDTTHSMPGEVLDFLAVLPYLNENAVVILDDVTESHCKPHHIPTNATINLFVSATCPKELPYSNPLPPDANRPNKPLANIGVMYPNSDTLKYIDSVFYALFIAWRYLPEDKHLNIYRELYEKHYTKEQLYMFDSAVEANKKYVNKKSWDKGLI